MSFEEFTLKLMLLGFTLKPQGPNTHKWTNAHGARIVINEDKLMYFADSMGQSDWSMSFSRDKEKFIKKLGSL